MRAESPFEDVYDRHVDFVWRTVARLGVPAPAVEDVVQEVFLVVLRRLDSFDGRSSMTTWLYAIVRRVVKDHRRALRRKPAHRVGGDETRTLELLRDAGELPDGQLAAVEAARILHQLLDALDDDRREVFVLAELEQLPMPAVAEILGIGVNTAHSRLRMARETFHAALARHRARDARMLPRAREWRLT